MFALHARVLMSMIYHHQMDIRGIEVGMLACMRVLRWKQAVTTQGPLRDQGLQEDMSINLNLILLIMENPVAWGAGDVQMHAL